MNNTDNLDLKGKVSFRCDEIEDFLQKVSKIVGIISVALDDHNMFEFNYCGFNTDVDCDYRNAVVISLKRSFKKKWKNTNIYFSEDYRGKEIVYRYSDFLGNVLEYDNFEDLFNYLQDEYIFYMSDKKVGDLHE